MCLYTETAPSIRDLYSPPSSPALLFFNGKTSVCTHTQNFWQIWLWLTSVHEPSWEQECWYLC